ncbi:MAG: sigma-70 family RNA polymerase sigma factor [Bacteroidales bacterium]|nr:sigma-70 family RNA polymerase sigma factor [Bacteroidales bacterium]
MNKQIKFTEKELVNGILNGQNDVLQLVYDRSFKSVRHLVISNSGKEVDAEDIFQEAFVVLFNKLRDKNFKLTCSLNTYLYSVSRLLWLKELESRKNRKTNLSECDEFVNLSDDLYKLAFKNERLNLYREIFEELSEDCKKVLQLFLNDVPITEITKIMGFSSDQHTKNRRYRCKKSLINKIRSSKEYKELKNENYKDDREIPRW